MIDCLYILKGYLIFELNYFFFVFWFELVYEEFFDEIGYDFFVFMCYVFDGVICGNGSVCLYNDVRYVWSEVVGLVIYENVVVGWVFKWDIGSWSEGWFVLGFGELMGNEKVGYVVIFGFCFGSLFDVLLKIGWFFFEKMEIVVF